MRRRSAQFTVAHAGQAIGAVIGVEDVAIGVVLRRRNADAGNQSVGIVGKLRDAAHCVGDLVQPADGLISADVGIGRHVSAGVRRRLQPRQSRLHDVEAHAVVHLVEDEDLLAVRTEGQLQFHALHILEGLRTGPVEEVLRSVAVLPDEILLIVQRQRGHFLVRVGLPTKAAVIGVRSGETAVVIVIDGNRVAIAGHDGIGMRQHHIAVEQVGIDRTRAAGAALLILPPVLDTRMGNVVDIHDGAIAGGSVRGIQLRVIGQRRIVRRAERDAIVVADAVGVSRAPLAVKIRQVEGEPAAGFALHALQGFRGDVAGAGQRVEIGPVDTGGFPRFQNFISSDVLGGAGGLDRHLQHRLNNRVAGLRDRQNVELQQTHAVNARSAADADVILRVGTQRQILAQRGILNVVHRVGGMDDGVDGHGIDRVCHEQRINGILHADIFARVSEDDLRKRFLPLRVVHQRRVHHERDLAGLRILHQQLHRVGHFIVERLRQANRGAGQCLRVFEDDILLHAVAHHGIAYRNARQDTLVGVFRLQLDNVAALLLSGFDLGGQIRTAETFHRAADKLRHGLRPRHQAFLLQLCAGAGNCLYGLRLLFEAPRERAAVFGDGGHIAAIHLLREFHMHAVSAVAENLTALRRDGLLECVVNFLPRIALRIAEMDGLGIDYRLMAVRAQIEVLDVFVAQRNLFLADDVVKQRFQALALLSLLRETKERLFVALKTIVFHSFSPFLGCCWGCAPVLFADFFRVRLLMKTVG